MAQLVERHLHDLVHGGARELGDRLHHALFADRTDALGRLVLLFGRLVPFLLLVFLLFRIQVEELREQLEGFDAIARREISVVADMPFSARQDVL